MAFLYSNVDTNNLRWMANDNSCATLMAVQLVNGHLRGLSPFKIDFSYPISVIAGENGSGKSTLLAMVACAFHNTADGYKAADRANPYYTFSDFFIQSKEETPPQGIRIRYGIRHDNWFRAEPGPRLQTSKKREGGRWSDYAARVNRNVIYFGIQRVVPHFERGPHKSYRGRFRVGALGDDVRRRIADIAGRIIGRAYSEFEIYKHSKYSLPMASSDGIRYSGFNMGAGESAVFDILTALFEAGRGTLLVIDEIELGLHEKAQRRLIHELKTLCKVLHCQIICSTHSHVVLDVLPPEGRLFVETRGGKTLITPEISADLACGKLSGRNAGELDVFVEDGAAKSILEVGLPLALRERIKITPIGSSEAVLRQLAARYLEGKDDCLAILDGDKRSTLSQARQQIRKYVETRYRESENEINRWSTERLEFLPGTTWPEKWLIESAQAHADKGSLVDEWGAGEVGRVNQGLANALLAGKHSEFHTLCNEMHRPFEQVRADVIGFVKRQQPDMLQAITERIERLL